MRPLIALSLTLATVVLSRAAGAQTDTTKPPPPPPPSLYTEEQATRGEQVYAKICIDCHEKTEYTGADFRVKWNDRPAFDLVDLLRKTMPDGDPGTLPIQSYVDVVGYMMKLNGVPAGKIELAITDSLLKSVKIDIPASK